MAKQILPVNENGKVPLSRLKPGQSFLDEDGATILTLIEHGGFGSCRVYDHKLKDTESMGNGGDVVVVAETFDVNSLLSARADVSSTTTDNNTGDTTTMAKKTSSKATKKAAGNGNGGGRYQLFEYPVTAVLRAMGKTGFTVADAEAAMKGQKIDCARATIQIQVNAGAKGERGEPAKLSAEQWEKLNKFKGAGETAAPKTQTKARETKKAAPKAGPKKQTAARETRQPLAKPKKSDRKPGRMDTSNLALPKPGDSK